ncbi:MAG TPA: tetratricopeptide repeat protein [Polyangiaceae bacterium]|nr:tetratricopeptide repeat protein [Polyangiaceae bacterium]
MTRRLDDLPRFPLREHGSSERVERIWRRLAPELASAPVWARPQAFWAPAALVVVFGAGVFVGARWVHPDNAPLASAERPSPVEQATGQQAPRTVPAGPTNPRVHVPPPVHHARSPGMGAPQLAPSVAKLAAPVASVVPTTSTPEWERLAEAGDFEAAHTALVAQGSFESVLGTASASQSMTLGDIARASGSREHAIAALRRVVENFRGAPEAPLAAWTLGNLLDQAGDDSGAASAYALYRRLSPGGDFAEDALAREIDSALSLSDLELSARLIAQYENEFPNGRSLEEFRAELARRSERVPAPGADGTQASEPAAPSDAVHPDAAGSKPLRADDAPAGPAKPSQK